MVWYRCSLDEYIWCSYYKFIYYFSWTFFAYFNWTLSNSIHLRLWLLLQCETRVVCIFLLLLFFFRSNYMQLLWSVAIKICTQIRVIKYFIANWIYAYSIRKPIFCIFIFFHSIHLFFCLAFTMLSIRFTHFEYVIMMPAEHFLIICFCCCYFCFISFVIACIFSLLFIQRN